VGEAIDVSLASIYHEICVQSHSARLAARLGLGGRMGSMGGAGIILGGEGWKGLGVAREPSRLPTPTAEPLSRSTHRAPLQLWREIELP